MVFKGRISVDPSEVTKIKKIEPSSTIRKFLKVVSMGKIKDLVEEENFKAFSILGQFHSVLRNLGIDNIIRLSHNNTDYYLDKSGNEKDLNLAFDNYQKKVEKDKSEFFETLSLVIEHQKKHFHYYIEIKINKSHKVGDYPIELRINGLLGEFEFKGTNSTELLKRMEPIFSSQDAYEHFCSIRKREFYLFLELIAQNISEEIKVDDLKIDTEKGIILSDRKIKLPSDINLGSYDYYPAFHNYFGTADKLYYAYLWAMLCSDHDVYVNNCIMYSENGGEIGKLEEQGIDSGDSSLFDINNFEEEEEGDIFDEEQKDWF